MPQISRRSAVSIVVAVCGVVAGVAAGTGQIEKRPFSGSLDHPSIEYARRATVDLVAQVNERLEGGAIRLAFDDRSGYLRSVLQTLDVPVESQLMVFSRTGVQSAYTSPTNPRALFFNDSVVVGYIQGAPVLELAAHDPRQGAVFYILAQNAQGRPVFTRRDGCLSCHVSYNSLDVPGMLVRSQFTAADGRSMRQLGQYVIDHRSPLAHRWGGYYVTGTAGSSRHMGNATVIGQSPPDSRSVEGPGDLMSLEGKVDTKGYPLPTSDLVALMVFDHQMHMINLLTRIGWEVRVAAHEQRLDLTRGPQRDTINELVDYVLFVDEARLSGRVRGATRFAEQFSRQGPRDKKGRSLRQLDLEQRLMRYPCSYMIYANAFDSLPEAARSAIYERMWQILSGKEKGSKYSRLSAADRRAIVEILRDTKAGLPDYFSRDTP
jgi:hypothetical protein